MKKYHLRLAGRHHRPPTGHPGNEKEAKGPVSLTGKMQLQNNSGDPSVHFGSWRQAYDIITDKEKAANLLSKPEVRQLHSCLLNGTCICFLLPL